MLFMTFHKDSRAITAASGNPTKATFKVPENILTNAVIIPRPPHFNPL